MKQIFLCAIGCALLLACNNPKPAEETTTPAVAAEAKSQATEFADSKYADIGKRDLAALSSGDIDKWMEDIADNARFFWNGGDSIIGKAAISAYWKKRRSEVIDSINYMNDIWLPVKVNQPQQQVQSPGVWLLGWYQVHAKYKTGKSMSQWIHTDYHFDASDKIDQVIQYIDRAPINAAIAK
ncbi:MAG TPA: nuclear transport factor 2 family protein [Panacibacter sp.]|nr:nuclear transport factor 2 family protein [Panacibacter sp.]